LGTASKAVTSAAVGLLLEQDRLKLDDEIQKYVPEFPKKQWPVTLRQLLAHTAGLATDAGDEGPFGDHCERPVEGLKFVADDALRFEPDTQYRYSTFGWIVVSAAIEAVTHEPFARFMKTQVLEPLGMHDTRLDSKTEEIANRATFYFPRFAADNRYGMQFAPDVDYSCYAGSIGFLSTPSDMVRFAIGMNRGTLLKHATVQLLQTSQRLRSGTETGYGLGWDLETATVLGKSTPTIGYDGESIGGTVGSFLIFPEHGITVALLTNTSWVDSYSVAVKVAETFARTTK
jgi:CubicO group peptidase (beta-lactamase class C family)